MNTEIILHIGFPGFDQYIFITPSAETIIYKLYIYIQYLHFHYLFE